MKITLTKDIEDKCILNLLCCAFEGGSNYWYLIEKVNYPPGMTNKDYAEGGKAQRPDEYWHWSQLVPMAEGGSLVVGDKHEQGSKKRNKGTLDRASIKKGLQVMAEKYPKHFANVVAETEDGDTGDVFLQCCLFGELVFG
jgi:hypothetical protein